MQSWNLEWLCNCATSKFNYLFNEIIISLVAECWIWSSLWCVYDGLGNLQHFSKCTVENKQKSSTKIRILHSFHKKWVQLHFYYYYNNGVTSKNEAIHNFMYHVTKMSSLYKKLKLFMVYNLVLDPVHVKYW